MHNKEYNNNVTMFQTFSLPVTVGKVVYMHVESTYIAQSLQGR